MNQLHVNVGAVNCKWLTVSRQGMWRRKSSRSIALVPPLMTVSVGHRDRERGGWVISLDNFEKRIFVSKPSTTRTT